MRLNHDCVRAVLLSVESMKRDEVMGTSSLHENPFLKSFDRDEAFYAVEKLIEAGFLNSINTSSLGGSSYRITGITWHGHQFLDNIRDDGVWKETKKKASKVAGVSLDVVSELASATLKRMVGLD